MQTVARGIYLLELEFGQAYLWDWGEALALIDSGITGSAAAIVDAVASIGRRPGELTEIVLTHYHDDHIGGATELVARTGARVLAHRADAPVIRREQPPVAPVLEDFERPILEAVMPRVPRAEAVRVDYEVDDGDLTSGGGVILSVPGHTPGSIALHVPSLGVLFTGDTIASRERVPILGVFNVDRRQTMQSVSRLAQLDFDVACFGHGAPVVGSASARIRALADNLPV
jgi:glyoxylase-like metal-dependent hydrolase (beta-lactamase superfamily II)